MTFYFFSLILFSLHLYATTAAQKSNHQFLGCFLDTELLTLGEESRTLKPISPHACSTFCSGKKYLFFILKNENCYCSKNYISRLMKQFDNECTIKCTGDESASCGGKNLVSSYITDSSISKNFVGHGSFPIPIYLGCYAETPNDDENRILKGPAGPYNNNTPQKCLEICFMMGYLYFGNTYGKECWCGNQKPLKSAKVENVNCDTPCSGDNSQLCGGGWKMAMYSTGITDYTAKNYVGCYDSNDDDEPKTKEKRIIFEMNTNNSPKRCMNLCNTQRFKYAATKDKVCECMNSAPRHSLKRSQSDCHILCTENPSEYCGGRNAFSIYKTIFSDPPGKVNVNHIGCFRNYKRHPTVNGWGITSSNLTPNHCVHSCYARRFPYAALISSRECLCSFTKPSTEGKIEDNMCNTACSGSSQQTCGGQNAIDIFNTGLEWRTHTVGNYYLGCFEESQNKRIFHGFSRPYDVNTPEFCSNLCYKLGFAYSGVTYKHECFCGDQPPSQPRFSKVDDKQCNTKCAGDANQFCGGGWRMGVFSTGLIDFEFQDQNDIGCFVQEDIPLYYRKFELINTNAPGKCSTICHNDGYTFSGVMGINCFCSDRKPEDDQKVDNTYCDIACVGDSSKTCGGEDRIHIYDLSKKFIEPIIVPDKLLSLEDSFEQLNLNSTWSHDVFIAQEPDYEFVVYNSSKQNSFVDNGELVIRPTVQSDSFIKNGELLLNGCTKSIGSISCEMNAVSFNILPPVVSARLTTKKNLLFHFGQVEVIAKLPIGDWIVSEIALVSVNNELNKLVLAKTVGNTDLKCNGSDEGANFLRYGLEIDQLYYIESKVMKLKSENGWHNDYHTFKLSWSSDNMIFEIDGEGHRMATTNLPTNTIFESEFFLSIGVSVGGMKNFQEGCLSNGHLKPWTNLDNKAMLNFWKDRNHWLPTWSDDKSALRVKQVKITLSES
ncbi:uncharacterized protein LOC113551491 [Rhopalosiphum maidis]|uniref:uncharacterized protein LOC113551491 n=1 Tax=Rhopalosiphum maidis TaxID=43146 RepID=UPI000EFE5D2D|nr:uncharacterized protein LOC113551491 [Rhopalosiphum maidis]